MDNVLKILTNCNLKITPQRVAVLNALIQLNNHPTAENIITFISENFPNIAVGTVYKTLELFVNHRIITKVSTEKDIMRYDMVKEHHHHLYCSKTNIIDDYFDEELNQIIKDYFKNKNIPNFKIEEINLQIIGNFIEPPKQPDERK